MTYAKDTKKPDLSKLNNPDSHTSSHPKTKPISFRLNVMGVLLTFIFVVIIMQIIRIQNSELAKEFVESNKPENAVYTDIIFPARGDIYDCWGRLLAGNRTVYEIGVDLIQVKNPKTIAETLANVVGLDYLEVYQKVSTPYNKENAVYVVLDYAVEPETIETLSTIKQRYEKEVYKKDLFGSKNEDPPSLSGLKWHGYLQRSYPEHQIASNVIGFYSFLDRDKGRAYYGVEEQYHIRLSGTPKEIIRPLNPGTVEEVATNESGESLILTIDLEIQSMVEKVLDQAVVNSQSKSGTIIVMDPQTGEILAMAVTLTNQMTHQPVRMNPNQYWNLDEIYNVKLDEIPAETENVNADETSETPTATATETSIPTAIVANEPTENGEIPFNKAIGETYEPGSVFKILTMAAALDAGVVEPDTIFLDEGSIQIGGTTIHNWDNNAYNEQTMTGCLQHSLNVCLVWVAQQLGTDLFYEYLERFGIDKLTNIDLANEVNWPLSIPGDENWYPVNLGTNSFGQGLAVTPIQMITAIAAVANEGKMMAPHVVKASIKNGELYENSPQMINRPISPVTAKTLTDMLAISLENEASTALVPGYRVAGKTGTAQISTGADGYDETNTNASFVGWGPVENPKFIIYVWLEEPKSSPWGSVVAAPVFSQVAQNLVTIMNIPPDDTYHELYEGETADSGM